MRKLGCRGMEAGVAILNRGVTEGSEGPGRCLEHPGRGNSLNKGPRWECEEQPRSWDGWSGVDKVGEWENGGWGEKLMPQPRWGHRGEGVSNGFWISLKVEAGDRMR